MLRNRSVASALALTFSMVVLNGCGSDNSTGDIKVSPEASKADEAGRKAVEDMMKSKGAPKAKGAESKPTSPVAPK